MPGRIPTLLNRTCHVLESHKDSLAVKAVQARVCGGQRTRIADGARHACDVRRRAELLDDVDQQVVREGEKLAV